MKNPDQKYPKPQPIGTSPSSFDKNSNPNPVLSKNIITVLIVIVVIIVAGVLLAINVFKPEPYLVDDTPLQTNRQLPYKTQSECEDKTQSKCIYYLCDIPIGELYQQLCVIVGTGSGWYSTVYTNRFADDEGGDEEIDASTWQTYRNDEFGFEVSHPQSWQLKDSGRQIDIKDPKNKYPFNITVEEAVEDKNKFISDLIAINKNANIEKDSVLKIGDLYTLQIKHSTDILEGIDLFAFKDNLQVEVSLLMKKNDNERLRIITQILSTFRFVEEQEK